MDRRQFLAAGSTVAVAAVAGCAGAVPGIGGGDDIDTGSPEGIVESYIELQEELFGNPESIEDTATDLYHSESPAIDALDEFDGGGMQDSEVDFEFEVTDIEGVNVVDSDLSAGDILQAAPTVPDDRFEVDEGTANALASEETALVDAAYTTATTAEMPDQDEPQTFENEVQSRFLVATDEGDWQIVFENQMTDQ